MNLPMRGSRRRLIWRSSSCAAATANSCAPDRRATQIDGELDEWTEAPAAVIDQAEQVGFVEKPELAWGGPTDLSAHAFLRWDGGRVFYLAMDVTDDAIVQQMSGEGIWKGGLEARSTPGCKPISPRKWPATTTSASASAPTSGRRQRRAGLLHLAAGIIAHRLC